jgi:hypothetical protein
MAIEVTCSCGQDFAVPDAGFPRTLSCHACGRKVVLTAPGQITVIAEAHNPEIAAGESDISATAAPPCYSCRAPANRACRCGKCYCPMHGGQLFFGQSCVECYDSRRAKMRFGALFGVAIGSIFVPFLATAPKAGEHVGWTVLSALVFSAVAGFLFWSSVRRFPV